MAALQAVSPDAQCREQTNLDKATCAFLLCCCCVVVVDSLVEVFGREGDKEVSRLRCKDDEMSWVWHFKAGSMYRMS